MIRFSGILPAFVHFLQMPVDFRPINFTPEMNEIAKKDIDVLASSGYTIYDVTRRLSCMRAQNITYREEQITWFLRN